MKIREIVRKFLERECAGGELLLALSGGPDSLSLFYALLQLRVKFSVAHVNHGLREKSSVEEAKLRQIVEEASIPFFVKRLSLESGGNLEERARIERYAFFEELISSKHYEAVVLGHHADDQGETLIKRLFEGASLRKWHGMQPVSKRGSLTLFRPLLTVRKKEIVSWLEKLGVVSFEDWTNLSDQNLRGRLRTNLFPHLNEQFGKDIVSPLIHHQKEVAECVDLLDELTKHVPLETEELNIPPLHPALQKHLVRKWLEHKETAMAATTLDDLIFSIPLSGKRSFPTQKKPINLVDCKIYF